MDAYEKLELDRHFNVMRLRTRLGAWREEELPDLDQSIARLSWLLNGTYGHGAMLYARMIVKRNLDGKKGKNIDKAWLAIGRELVMQINLLDTTEYTLTKLTECYKKQGVNFATINARAADEIKRVLAEEGNS